MFKNLTNKSKDYEFVYYSDTVIGVKDGTTAYLNFNSDNSKKFLTHFIEDFKHLLKLYKAIPIQDQRYPDRVAFKLNNGITIKFTCDYFTYQFIYSYLNKKFKNKDLYMGNIIKEALDLDEPLNKIQDRLNEVFDVY